MVCNKSQKKTWKISTKYKDKATYIWYSATL